MLHEGLDDRLIRNVTKRKAFEMNESQKPDCDVSPSWNFSSLQIVLPQIFYSVAEVSPLGARLFVVGTKVPVTNARLVFVWEGARFDG